MYKNKLKLFILIFLISLTPVIFANDCFFEINNNDCQRFSSSFIKFDLTFNPNSQYKDYEVEIYKKDNPSNKILTRVEGNSVYNLNPLTEVGVYVLKVRSNSITDVSNLYEKEFIFDNSQPFPPIIEMGLESSQIQGKTQIGNTNVLAEVIGSSSPIETQTSSSSGEFSFNLNLPSPINLVKFYTQNSNNINSEYIERIIYKDGKPKRNFNINANSISIDSHLENSNYNTYFDSTNNIYITSKRNFYISGQTNAPDGAIIYINGVQSIVKGNTFGAIVILNEGRNKITIENRLSTINKTLEINFITPKFNFLNLDYNKITSSNSLEITGTATLDLPFNIYLNGKYIDSIAVVDGKFTTTLNNLIPGKNYISFEGYNNNLISDIIYFDSENPIIKVISNLKTTSRSKFIFKITDDIGINLNSINVQIGNKNFNSSSIESKGDYFSLSLLGLNDGDFNYRINVKDLTGKEVSTAGQIEINSRNTIIEDIQTNNGYFIGNKILLHSSQQTIKLIPSRNIAFKSIYLDGIRQTNYHINLDKSIDLTLNLDNEEGVLEFKFINNEYQEFTETYNYFTDKIKPIIKLDYINNPNSYGENRIRVTGEIEDSNFNWSSLTFNSDSSFRKYGKYFEAQVLPNEGLNNLEVGGKDLAGNLFKERIFGSLLFKDSTNTVFENLGSNKIGFKTAISSIDNRNKNYAYFWDGQKSYQTYLNTQEVILPVSERVGIRAVNLKGVESSKNKFTDIQSYTIDPLKPEVYFVLDEGIKRFLVNPTLSQINNISFKVNGVEIDVSECDVKIARYSKCYDSESFNSSNIEIEVVDKAGNKIQKTFSQTEIVDISTIIPTTNTDANSESSKIYFNGNDLNTINNNWFVEGNIKSLSVIKSIKAQGKDCLFDDTSFVCYVDLPYSLNNIDVIVEFENNPETISPIHNNITINRTEGEQYDIKILDLNGDGIFKMSSDYYIKDFIGNLVGKLDKEAIVTLVIDNNRELIGIKNSTFTVNIDLTNQLATKDNDEFYIQLEAKGDSEIISTSNKIKLIYNRILDTILNIIVY